MEPYWEKPAAALWTYDLFQVTSCTIENKFSAICLLMCWNFVPTTIVVKEVIIWYSHTVGVFLLSSKSGKKSTNYANQNGIWRMNTNHPQPT